MKAKQEHIKQANAIIKNCGGWREKHVITEPCNYYYLSSIDYIIIQIVKKSVDGSPLGYGVNDCCQVNLTTKQITG